jgi:endonuclease IV
MVGTKTLTEEQKKAKKYASQKKYMAKVWSHHHYYPNLEESYHFTIKCFLWSVILNAVLLITTVLWWIL